MLDSVAQAIPPFYATAQTADPLMHVKLFTPDSSWTWFVMEYDPRTRICIGLVEGIYIESSCFSIDEIEQARGPLGLPVERDLYCSPQPLSVARRDLTPER